MTTKPPVYFDRSGALLTVVGVLTGAVLTLVSGVLIYHFWYVHPHTVPVNPQNRGVSVGFEVIPEDMEPYRGLVSYTAQYGPSAIWHPEFFSPPAVWPGGLNTTLVYWDRSGQKRTRQSSFIIACDPQRVYYPIDRVREVILYQLDDRGYMFTLVSVPVQNPPPTLSPLFLPRVMPSPSPTPKPLPSRSRVPA